MKRIFLVSIVFIPLFLFMPLFSCVKTRENKDDFLVYTEVAMEQHLKFTCYTKICEKYTDQGDIQMAEAYLDSMMMAAYCSREMSKKMEQLIQQKQ